MTRAARTPWRSTLTLLLAALLLAAPAPPRAPASTAPSAPVPGVYLARVPALDAYLAVLVDRREASAYLCDNGTPAKWFGHRRLRDGHISSSSRDGRSPRIARATRTGLAGHVVLDGHRYAFHAHRAHGSAGLYRAGTRTATGALEAGWILLSGSQRGTVNTFISNNVDLAVPKPVPPLDPSHPTVTISDGTSNTITLTAARINRPGFINQNIGL